MPIVDDVTAIYGFKKPYIGNDQDVDVARLRQALDQVDAALGGLASLLPGKANVSSLSDYQLLTGKNVANGYAGIDPSGFLPLSVVPPSIQGGLKYQTGWNANTNTPAIPPSSPAHDGWFWIVTVAGSTSIGGITTWNVGDWLIDNGTTFERIPASSLVTSVAGRTGAITLTASDIQDASANGRSLLTAANYTAMKALLAYGAAADRGVGLSVGNLIEVLAGGKLPVLDGSNLTALPPPDKLSTAGGSAPVYGARAWLNLNGNTGAIRSSGNISGVTVNGAGDYTIDFDVDMPHANYAVVGMTNSVGATTSSNLVALHSSSATGAPTLKTASQVRIACGYIPGSSYNTNMNDINIVVFC